MARRLVVALGTAQSLLACEAVIGITEITAMPTDVEVNSSPEQPEAGGPPDVPARESDERGAVDVLDAGEPKKRVFVTSTRSNGILGGQSGADALCAVAAARAKLDGIWIAWLSEAGATTPNAVDRISHDGPFVRLDGVPIARDKAQLTSGTLLAPMIVTELGDVLASPSEEAARVWTGTSSNGTRSADCSKWSTARNDILGTIGWLTSTTNGRWTDNGGAAPPLFVDWGCHVLARLYCFEL